MYKEITDVQSFYNCLLHYPANKTKSHTCWKFWENKFRNILRYKLNMSKIVCEYMHRA